MKFDIFILWNHRVNVLNGVTSSNVGSQCLMELAHFEVITCNAKSKREKWPTLETMLTISMFTL